MHPGLSMRRPLSAIGSQRPWLTAVYDAPIEILRPQATVIERQLSKVWPPFQAFPVIARSNRRTNTT